MNRTDAPKKQPVPFGINGQREDLLPSTPAGDNTASYSDGFPPVTMILKAAGGLPPKGQDMNQILFELSNICRWMSAGALNSFDPTFSTSIGGYPKAAVVIGDDGTTPFISTTDANNNNPNSNTSGWLSLSKIISIAGLSGGANKLAYFTGTNTSAQTDLTQVGRDIIGKADIASVISYLGLGTASKKDVGTAAGQIPDMSSFTSGSGWQKLPSGKIIQWGGTGIFNGDVTTTYPIPFPTAARGWVVSQNYTEGTNSVGAIAGVAKRTEIVTRAAIANNGGQYIVIGD